MQVKKEEDKELPASVTLAVTLDEAERLVLADESGVLRLALKPAADNKSIQTNGAVKDDMVLPKGKIGN
jgi:Flp pilus assembly protein CpaB